ncbi:MAG: transferase [Spirochaetae bacterium HGW-Spirochaetae-2]|jgi:acetyltransferase-like isoleucine patch superfamily enzyme|nr:MAG: transferase [Spirochaetae bacterium HGW-Spirochaetae-2]
MSQISKNAIIHDGVKIGKNVTIRDFSVIYPGVIIGDNVEIMEGSIIGRLPKGAKAVARKPLEEYKTVEIGNDCVISTHSIIYTDVLIGEGTLIGDGASIREQCKIGCNCIISRYVTINYNTSIGNRTKIMDNTHITGNMIIGDDVFISIQVSTTNDNNIGRKGYDDSGIKGPTISNNVSIGAGANILPRILIGEGSIVAAGSIVTKDVKPNCLVMGIPAKFVKHLDLG